MRETTYLIDYGVYFNNKYESHITKVKRCMSSLHAQVKLEDYLKKKYVKFEKLIVHKCKEDTQDIFNIFNDIFK